MSTLQKRLAQYPKRGSVQDKRHKWVQRLKDGTTKKIGPPCCVCGEPSECVVWVEVNIFRGDDESAKTCWKDRDNVAAIVASGTLKG